MDVVITTSASNDNECYELLRAMGLPIREKRVANNTEEENG
jgi:large subunit ribosomal protein L5